MPSRGSWVSDPRARSDRTPQPGVPPVHAIKTREHGPRTRGPPEHRSCFADAPGVLPERTDTGGRGAPDGHGHADPGQPRRPELGRDFFTAAPFWGLRPQVFPPAVYHDQRGSRRYVLVKLYYLISTICMCSCLPDSLRA